MLDTQTQIELLELAIEYFLASQLQNLPEWQVEAIENYFAVMLKLQRQI